TAYLDEAERCNRVALMDRGKLLRLDTPQGLKESLPEVCYEVHAQDLRAARAALTGKQGITSVDLSGDALHVFAQPGTDEATLKPAAPDIEVRRILPSLEDVFITTVRKEACRDAA